MGMGIEKEEKLLISNYEHIERKQNPFLQSRTFSYYGNRRIRSHYEDNTLVRRRVNNVHIKNYKLSRTKLRDYEKRNVDHYLNNQEIKKISRRNTEKSQNRHRS